MSLASGKHDNDLKGLLSAVRFSKQPNDNYNIFQAISMEYLKLRAGAQKLLTLTRNYKIKLFEIG